MNARWMVAGMVAWASMTSLASGKLKALIIDGQNNHGVWPKSTIMMKQYLEASGRFDTVDIARTRYTWKGEHLKAYMDMAQVGETEMVEEAKTDPDFAPNFKAYDVVISNFGYGAADWPEETQKSFEEYVSKGGGFVVVHAADNCFPKWLEYNKMIGLGGWAGRNEKDGPYVYFDDDGKEVRDESPGGGGTHGAKHSFPVTVRDKNHPITKGLPKVWLTAPDELYAKMRGPAENMTILATGRDISPKAPTQRHEPVLLVIKYGKGRVFHTMLGHDEDGFECIGFITTFLRGTEWAASGRVTIPVPKNFPTETESTRYKFEPKK
jgi:type 1 glutamine amidotransferase